MLTTASASAARGGVRGEGTPELGLPRPSYSAGSAFKASARRALTERGYSTHLWVSLQYTPGLVGKGAPGLIGHMALPVTGWRSRRRFRRRSRSDAKHFPSFLSEATKPYPSAEHAASASEASTFEDLSTSGARACRLAPSDMRADACAAEAGASVVVGKQRRVSVTRKRTSPRTERLRETNATVASREEDNDARGGPVICPRTPSPSTSRALRVPVRRGHLQAGTRARFARRHAVFVRLARAPLARPPRSPPRPDPRALRAMGRESSRLLSASTPSPTRSGPPPVRTTGSSRWSRGRRNRHPSRPLRRPSTPRPVRRNSTPRDERPKPPPLRRRREIPCVLTSRDRTRRRCPLPSFPTPSSAPLASLPRLRLPPAPDPSWSRRNRPLTPNPPHRMSPTRPSSDRPRPMSPARWTRARRESRGAPADSQESRRE